MKSLNNFKILFIILISSVSLMLVFQIFTLMSSPKGDNSIYSMPNGFVPDEMTAVKIGEAVLSPIYGDRYKNARPYSAKSVGEVWQVIGTLPKGFKGGTPGVIIQKKDGKILRVYHGK